MNGSNLMLLDDGDDLLRTTAYQRTIAKQSELSLVDFIRLAWRIIEPAREYLHNWHIDAMGEYLTAVTNGQITRLIINVPPRYMKSITTTVMWPCWVWGPRNAPSSQWIFSSYAQSLSTKHSRDRRVIMEDNWYRSKWGSRFWLSKDNNLKTAYSNNKRGQMITTSTRAGVMGQGADFIVIDDPHNVEQAESQNDREKAVEKFDQELVQRLNDKKTGAIVVIMQRLHIEDLAGHLLKQGGYEHLCLPCIAEGDPERIIFPLSLKTHVRIKNQLLWPEREAPEQIRERKRVLGTRGFAGQYQQRPVPLSGGVFQFHWFKYYQRDLGADYLQWQQFVTAKPLPDGTNPFQPVVNPFLEVIQSWDTAVKTGENNDYSVCTTWGLTKNDAYLLDRYKEKVPFPVLKRVAIALADKWKPSTILIEDASSGQQLIQEFQENTTLPIKPFRTTADKLYYANTVSPIIEGGHVFLPDPRTLPTPWFDDYIHTMCAFTGDKGEHDDDVDSTTKALTHFRGSGNRVWSQTWGV